MAKKGYPGLVLVPPSDRQILRRRLARWTFLIIALIWGLSSINIWLPSPSPHEDCETAISHGASPDSKEECGQDDHIVTESRSRQNETTVMTASQTPNPADLRRYVPMTAPDTTRPPTQRKTNQALAANPKSPENTSSNHAATPHEDKLAASPTAERPAPSPNRDTLLAERGDAFAQYRLGRFYAQYGGPQAPESVGWYRKASDGLRHLAWAGNGEAMYVLGVMYAFGRGVTKDTEQARLWLSQAVERQVEAARPVLGSLERHRSPQSEHTTHGG